jgi:hypothetical protein
VAVESGTTALSLFPSTSESGLGTFPSATAGTPYDNVVPVGPMDARFETRTRREAMADHLGHLKTNNSTTGLARAVLAAYQERVAQYVPGRLNLLAVITDGEDMSRTTAGELQTTTNRLSQLAADKPVKLLFVTVGRPPSDVVKQLADAVGTKPQQVNTANDILDVFSTAASDFPGQSSR